MTQSFVPRPGDLVRWPVQGGLFLAIATPTCKEAGFCKDSLTFNHETVEDLVNRAKSAKTQAASAGMLPWLSIGDGIAGRQLMSSRRAGGDRGALQPEFRETAGR